MTSSLGRLVFATGALIAALSATDVPADPVIPTHPRLLFDDAGKIRLLAKVSASDPSWLALKAQADTLATYAIYPYTFATSSDAPPGTIYYTYQGEGWLAAALPLAFAYQMTGDTTYSDKLLELAQEMIRAQSDPQNNPPIGLPPIQLDSYYASRTVASTLAFIYDYCYDQLGPTLKSDMVALMNQYYDDVSVNGYQAQQYSNAADGNYFGGHLYGLALMGYASFGDNPRAEEMIEWARIRFDGTPGPALPPSAIPDAWRTQVFDGGLRPAVALDFKGPDITGNPFKGGFDFQAWSYGSEEFGRMIDYMLTVQSATGEDVLTPHSGWFPQILHAEMHALFPNRFMIDPTGDWGGYQGAVISRALPKRLAFLLAGTPDGPGAQYFAETEIGASTIPGAEVYPAEEWAEFFFADSTRPSTQLPLPPYYTGFAPNYPQGAPSPGGTNGAIPYFIMRSDWGPDATWASVQMGSEWWDDHQHYNAGHLVVARGSDYLLVSASDWKTATDGTGTPIHGGPGILGDSLELQRSSLANTLYFDDFGDFQSTDELASGGQLAVGIDQVIADELTPDFGYVRSDLSTAYNRAGDPADIPNRKLDFFHRSFLYLRAPNVFVVYDQVAAKASTNPNGPYKKHMRWHVPDLPVITGTTARLDQGQSRLFLDVVLPASASLAVVDELANPDPCDGSDPGCVPFGANAGTFRIEVRDPLNPLFVPFLTVLQPGSNTSTPPTDSPLASLDGRMIGVDISQAGGARSIVLFNSQPGQVPPPITSTSYILSGSASAVSHTLLGVVPGALYSVALANGVVHVDQSPAGNTTSSPAGVLRFSNLVDVPVPLVSASKTVSGRFHEAEPVAYAIRLTNSGSVAALDTPADELQDTVPATLTVTGADDGGAAGTVSVVGNDVRWNGSIPAASAVTVTVQATINAGTVGSVVSNQGTINYDSDGNGTADTTAPTDDPALPGPTDPTSFTVTVPTGGDLVPGSARVLDLGAPPGSPGMDRFGLRQEPRSSYEVVVDGATGDLGSAGAGPALDLVAADGVTPVQASTPAGVGPSRSLRLENASAGPILDRIVRVTSLGCATNCTPEDQYRIRAWDTTLALARFNNSATQITVIVLQNTTGATVTGNVWLWDSSGAAAGTAPFTLAPRSSFVLNTSTLAPGVGGTVTVSHDAPYGTLEGKAVAVEPSTGFTFDTPLRPRPQ